MRTPVKCLSILGLILCCLPLWGCNNLTKTEDCRKYTLAISEAGKSNPIKTVRASDKKSFVTLLNAIADHQQQMGETLNSVQLQDVKLKEIQQQTFTASNEFANDLRRQAASVAALPGEPSKDEMRAAIKRNPQFQNNWVNSNNRYLEYCLHQR